jgi:hypothetical protein
MTSTADDTGATTSGAVQVAREAVVAARSELARWQSEQQDSAQQIVALEALAGDSILDEPDNVAEIESRIEATKTVHRAARRAVTAQELRVLAAESAYFSAEAAAVASELEQAEAALAKHEARTGQLLKQLEQHEGAFEPARRPDRAEFAVGVEGRLTKAPKSHAFRSRVQSLADQAAVLGELAAGRDPEAWIRANRFDVVRGNMIAAYPACMVDPEPLVAADSYLARCDAARERLAALLQRSAELAPLLRENEERLSAAGVSQPERDFVWSSLAAQRDGLHREIGRVREVLGLIVSDVAFEIEPDASDDVATEDSVVDED